MNYWTFSTLIVDLVLGNKIKHLFSVCDFPIFYSFWCCVVEVVLAISLFSILSGVVLWRWCWRFPYFLFFLVLCCGGGVGDFPIFYSFWCCVVEVVLAISLFSVLSGVVLWRWQHLEGLTNKLL